MVPALWAQDTFVRNREYPDGVGWAIGVERLQMALRADNAAGADP